MKINNATTAYFIIEKPRLGAEEYNRIVAQAEQNKLQTYKKFYFLKVKKNSAFQLQRIALTKL